MPFVYNVSSKTLGENITTSATPNTGIDHMFVKPGATRAFAILALRVQGKGAQLTSLSGIIFRFSQWFTTAASAGTSLAPTPVDFRAPAAVFTSSGGTSGGTAAVTAGTGGPTVIGGCGCGASGPGGWVAPNPDAGLVLDGGANKSVDVFSASGTASMNFEYMEEVQE